MAALGTRWLPYGGLAVILGALSFVASSYFPLCLSICVPWGYDGRLCWLYCLCLPSGFVVSVFEFLTGGSLR